MVFLAVRRVPPWPLPWMAAGGFFLEVYFAGGVMTLPRRLPRPLRLPRLELLCSLPLRGRGSVYAAFRAYCMDLKIVRTKAGSSIAAKSYLDVLGPCGSSYSDPLG